MLKTANAQTESEILTRADVMPHFEPGLLDYVNKHLTYPPAAREHKIDGAVFLRFVVMKDGSITEVEVLKSPNDLLSAESVRLISTMPKWKPGYQDGVPVNVRMVLPIRFSLEPSKTSDK